MFYLGGNAGHSNIEVHDVQFAAVEQVEDAYPLLRSLWFGDPDKLHLDGYMPITWADGYSVSLDRQPCSSGLALFFVNMGGYRSDSLAELHAFDLFVAASAEDAKAKARTRLLRGARQLHKDNLADVDNCLQIARIGDLHVHLQAQPHGRPDRPEWQGYRPIGVAAAH
jgi:hypothetical protein